MKKAIPRALWLDEKGQQLVIWPVEEVENLRGKLVHIKNKELKYGEMFEVQGIMSSQASTEYL